MTTLTLAGRALVLDERDLLGAGGEGQVYAVGDRAVKVYHPLDAAPPGERAAWASRLAVAAEKLLAFPRALPPEVVRPIDLVTDGQGSVVGFAMRRVRGAREIGLLARPRGAPDVGRAQACAIFRRLHEVLGRVHAAGVVVGDLNDANVLFSATEPALLDADSMQFAHFPCPVAHERFLDPRLYGVDLGAAPVFSPETDWYAFAVMLFGALLQVHPYGGSHPSLPTLLRRAEARHSVLRSDVVVPKSSAPASALPPDLCAWLAGVFDEGARGAPPPELLGASWSRCACGLEHARKACPACTAQGPRAAGALVHGSCRANVVARTRGRFVAAASHAGLRWAALEGDLLVREDGAAIAVRDFARAAIAGDATWIADAERVVCVRGGRAAAPISVSAFAGEPAFDAAGASCLGVVGDWVVDLDQGTRVGRALEGQTWLRTGERVGLGFWRAGSIVRAFVLRPGRGGLRDVDLCLPRGRMVDRAAFFDDDRALLSLAVDANGQRRQALFLVAADGRTIASAEGTADDGPLFASTRGKCVAHGAVLAASDEGLFLARPDPATGRLAVAKHFPDTKPFVSSDVDLLVGPAGSVYVVGEREIVHLRLA